MTIISEYHQCCQLSSCSISFFCTFLRTDVVIGPQWYVGWLAQINSLFFTDSSVEINADWKNGVGKFSPVQIVFQIQITLKSNSITKYKKYFTKLTKYHTNYMQCVLNIRISITCISITSQHYLCDTLCLHHQRVGSPYCHSITALITSETLAISDLRCQIWNYSK